MTPGNHLGSILYPSEPSNVPYSPNQFLAMDFFCHFLQQDGSNSQKNGLEGRKNSNANAKRICSHFVIASGLERPPSLWPKNFVLGGAIYFLEIWKFGFISDFLIISKVNVVFKVPWLIYSNSPLTQVWGIVTCSHSNVKTQITFFNLEGTRGFTLTPIWIKSYQISIDIWPKELFV